MQNISVQHSAATSQQLVTKDRKVLNATARKNE